MQRIVLAVVMAAYACATIVPPRCRADDKVAGAAKRPNILFLFGDDWAWPHASCLHYPQIKTPTFDRLAREGLLFRNAHCAAPSCSPSRAAILTGQWPWRLQDGANLRGSLAARFSVYPDLLEASGYFVGLQGKGYGPGTWSDRPRNPAGTSYKNFDAFLAARPQGKPFCFWFGCIKPHRPYRVGSGVQSGLDPAKVIVPPYLPDNDTVRSDICDYLAESQQFDRQAGAILETLERTGELDNTLIVMSGDNGWPFPRGKATLYDSGTHQPLAIRWGSKAPAGRAIDDFVSLADLAPTFLEVAELPIPKSMTARSLVPLLCSSKSGQVEPTRDHVLTCMETHVACRELADGSLGGYPMRSIITKDFHYIRNFRPDRWPAGDPPPRGAELGKELLATKTHFAFPDIDAGPTKAWLVLHREEAATRSVAAKTFDKRPVRELYDLRNDPYELKNLAEDPAYRETAATLDARLIAELKATDDPRANGGGDEFDHYGEGRKGVVGKKSKKRVGIRPSPAASTFVATSAPILSDAGPYDVVVYGGTSAAITAAIEAKTLGKSVVVVSPDKHLGGLSSGGLGWTDSGNKAVIGGLARQFYHRIWKHYQDPKAWRWQNREGYGNRGQGTAAIDKDQRTMWIFEPHVAEQVFDEWVKELEIPIIRNAWLDRVRGVKRVGQRITSISTLDGQTFAGRMFIDATYEGDLMAAAGVSFHVGREASSLYGETWNGVQAGGPHHGHWFKSPIDPYLVPGNPASGLLPRISPDPPGRKGDSDKRIQAYCFRMCLTNAAENRVPFPKPADYDPKQYELLLRLYASGWRETFGKFDPIPNRKTDTNNHGPFSTDNIGFNYDYPEASYARRREIIAEHESYQKGLMYFWSNDPRVPDDVRTKMSLWGLPKDEFLDNGHWPHQLYIREARRMLGRYVMTENELLKRRPTPEPVGMGSYNMDSHNVQRYVTPEGHVQNEGDVEVGTKGPYQISYGALVPKEAECENLLVPVCVGSSHIAFGSIRMEPVFMILGQSAATAAAIALDDRIAVQRVAYDKLRKRLLADGQVLEWVIDAEKRHKVVW